MSRRLLLLLLLAPASCHLLVGHSTRPGAAEAGRDRAPADRPSDIGARDQGSAGDLGSDRSGLDQATSPDKKLAGDQGKNADKKLAVDQGKNADKKLTVDLSKPPDKKLTVDQGKNPDQAIPLDAPPGSDAGGPGCSCSGNGVGCTSTCAGRTIGCTFLGGQWTCSCTGYSGTIVGGFPISQAFIGCQACDYAALYGFGANCNEKR